jgi:hypothetical protein
MHALLNIPSHSEVTKYLKVEQCTKPTAQLDSTELHRTIEKI